MHKFTISPFWKGVIVMAIFGPIMSGIVNTIPGCKTSQADRDAIHSLATAKSDVSEAAKDLSGSTKRLEGTAGDIQAKAEDGKAKTPEPSKLTLAPIWDGIISDAGKIYSETRLLTTISQKLDGVNTQLTTALGQVKDIGEKLDRTEKELAAQKSKLNTQLTLLVIFGVVGIGISIAVGVLLKDGRIAAAGAAGCAVMAVAAIMFSKLSGIAGILAIVAGIAALLAVLWIGAETIYRMKKDSQSFWDALKTAIATNPIEDIKALKGSV